MNATRILLSILASTLLSLGADAYAQQLLFKLSDTNNPGAVLSNAIVRGRAVARDGSSDTTLTINPADISVTDPAVGPSSTRLVTAISPPDGNGNNFELTTNASGQFALSFSPGAFTVGTIQFDQLDMTMRHQSPNVAIAVIVNQLSTDAATIQNISVVLNNVAVSVAAMALAPDGLIQSLSAGTADFLLAGDSGAASYQSREPSPVRMDSRGRMIVDDPPYKVQMLRASGGTDNYVIYEEADSGERIWAFGKMPITVCGCIRGQWVLKDRGYPIYYKNVSGSGKWIYFGFAEAKNPTRTVSERQMQRMKSLDY